MQTDSLQLVLELVRAQVDSLRQHNALRTAQLELGRRVGASGPVGAAPLDTAAAPPLPISLPEALRVALEQGPQYRAARANESAAEASLRAQRGDYLPVLSIGGLHQRYDTELFPSASNISSVTFSLSFPLWNNGQREIEVSRARVNRDVNRAIREDLERVVRRDVTSSYDAYQVSAAAVELALVAGTVATQTYRMQELRYRSGASTILDLLGCSSRPGRGRSRRGTGPLSESPRTGPAGSHTRPQTIHEQGHPVRPTHAVLLIALIAACNKAESAGKGGGGGGPAGGGGPPAMPVEAATARADTVVDAILATGQIEAMQSIELRPDVEGRLVQILVREGCPVARGTPLFKIDDAELKAQVAQIEAERDLARQSLTRTRDLLEQKASSQSELERAEATMRSNEAQLQRLKTRLDRTLVRAPFAGVMGQRLVSLGDYVTTDTRLAALANSVASASFIPGSRAVCRAARSRVRVSPSGSPPCRAGSSPG